MIAVVNRRAGGGHTFSRALNRALVVTKGGRGVSTETITAIEAFVEKYLTMLGEQNLPRPRIEFRANIAAGWLGADAWSLRDPSTTTLLLQKSILGDPRTLERVIAHEVIHHVDFMHMPEQEIAMIKLGIRTRDGHGQSFLGKAAQVNAAMGDGFVTVKSDAEYVKTKVKPFFLLIVPFSEVSPSPGGGSMTSTGKFGWAWAVRLSPDGTVRAAQKLAEGARLVLTTDERWLGGAKIKKWGGFSVPRGAEDQAELRRIFQEEPDAPAAESLRSWGEAQIVRP